MVRENRQVPVALVDSSMWRGFRRTLGLWKQIINRRSEYMLRSGDFALYQNQEYELYKNGDGTVNLVTDHPQSIEHGFIKDSFSKRFEKTVKVQEVTNAYYIKTYGKYKNVEVNVRTEDEQSYLIGTPDAGKGSTIKFRSNR